MKKFTRTGKKVLSVFLAALMVMTAWVFVAPEKAEAANGSYWLNVKVNVTNKADEKDHIQDSYWNITYRPNNGRGDELTMKYDLRENEYAVLSNESNNQYMHVSVPGFPTKMSYYHDATWDDKVHYTLCEIYVSSSKTNGGTLVNSPNKAIKSGGWGNSEVKGNFSWDDGSRYPYVATSKSISTATAASNIGIPPLGDNKDVSASTTTMQYYTTDQYGVRYEPTSYTFSGVTGLSTTGSIGNAYTATANESTTASSSATYQTATVKLDWKNSNSSNTSQHGDSTYTFKVYNPRYKVTYSGNGGTLGTNYTYAYLNQKVSADTSTATSNNVAGLTAEKFPTNGSREGYKFNGIWSAASGGTQYSADTKVTKNSTAYAHWTPIKYNAEFKGNRATYPAAVQEYLIANVATDFDSKPVAPTNVEEYDDGDYHYKFNGNWKNSSGNVYTASTLPIMTTAGARYKAQYNGTFVQADYSGVTAQQNEAARIKSNPNYEAIYTVSSRNSLQAALDAVVTGKGRTQQDVVDGYEQRIKDAIEALEGQKYSVVFMDGRDNSIIKFSYPNVFGDTIQYPANPSMSYDKNYHYTFNKWEGTAQETNLSTVEKNITIVARFNKAAHSFTEEHIDSTCVKQGGTKYTCATCGYSYTTYSGTYGDHVWSTEWTIDNPATCTQPGSKSHHCTLCTARKDETAIPALGHDYTGVEPEVIVPVSCDTIGVSIRECTRCGYNDYITTDPIGHKMKDTVTAPTCTSKGYTTSTCEVCGKTLIGSFTDPIAHNYVKKASECVAPSCVGVGYDVSYCSVCGLKKYDIIPAAGHSWNKEQTIDIEPTCTTKGQKSIHCSVCGVISTDTIEEIPAKGHSYDSGEVLASATCTQNGVKAYQCTVAGCGHTKTETIAKLGHDWKAPQVDYAATCISAGQQSTHCSRCNEVKDVTVLPALGHALTTTTTTATCTVGSKKIEKCSRCDYEKTTIISEALGHNFVAGTPVEATCASSGYIPYTCSRNCGVAGYDVINGGASKNHNWNITSTVSHGKTTVTGTCLTCGATFSETVNSAHDFKNIKSQTPATCKEVGSLVLSCADANCNETFTVTLAKNENAHKSVTNTLTEASCTSNGKVVSTCSDCGKTLATTEIPAKGHSFTEQTEYVASTCQTKGHITFKCANCTEKKTVELDVNSDAHKFENPAHHNATCSTPAYDEYTCAYGCGKTYKSFTGTADTAAHNWTFSTSQTGTTLTVTCECTICHTTHSQTVEVAEGHAYTNVEVTTQPTCSAEGTIKIACNKQHNSSCTSSVSATLPANPNAHKIKTIVTAATCTVEGTAYSYCELCKKTIGETVKIAALGHNYVGGEENIITAATCEADGVKTVKCTRCDDTIEIAIPKLGHTWNSGTIHNADCTHGGYTTYECSTCHTTKDVVPAGAKANGHAWNDWTIVNPTNDEAGSATRICKNCDETETVEIPAGNHTFDTTKYEEVKATCTKKGSRTYTCTTHKDCGVSITVETDFAQHSYVLKYSENATCTTAGKVVMECSVCHDTNNNVEIITPALGHDFSKETDNVASTCNTVGYVTKKCSRCDETETTYSSTLGDHSWGELKVVQTADETHPGIKVKQCSVCKLYEYEYTAPTGNHNWDEGVITTKATCTTEGTKTYTCVADGNCACTEDSKATYTETIPATGHTAKVEVKEATCTEAGYVKAVCEICHTTLDEKTLDKKEHAEKVTIIDPTCTTPGSKVYTCAVCGTTTKPTEEIPVVPHAYEATGEFVDATCTSPKYEKYNCKYCGEEKLVKAGEANGHTIDESKTITVPATCTTAGFVSKYCSCGQLMSVEVLGPSEHTWKSVTDELPKECDGSKVTYEKCSVCGVIKAESLNITENGNHVYVVTTETAATCTTAGKLVITCKNCENINAEVEVPAVGHTYGEGVLTAGDCVNDGYVTFTCTREGCTDAQTGHTITKNIGTKNHNYLPFGDSTPATCTSSGYQLYKCEYCGNEFKEILEAPASHVYEKQDTSIEPNCYQDGHYIYKCKNCNASYEYDVAATGNHEIKGEVIQAQTCTLPEMTKYTCATKDCPYEKTEITKSPLGHSFGDDWKVTKEPTETENGEQERSCTRGCGETETAPIPASIHNWSETPIETTDATCTEAATETYQCTGCDLCNEENGYKTYVKSIGVPLQHNVVVDYTAPTCTKDGKYVARCTLCGKEFVNETLSATGHSFNTYLQGTYVPATCQEDGSMTYACSNSGCSEITTITIPVNPDAHHMVEDAANSKKATCTEAGYKAYKCENQDCDHTYKEWTSDPVNHTAKDEWTVKKAATCSSIGYEVRTCKDCGAVMDTREIPANENLHNWKTVTVKADHTKSGYSYEQCENCGKMRNFKSEDIIKHNYSEIIDQKAATATENGYVKYKCECGETITLVVPASGHEFTSEVTTEPTCTKDGVRAYTCTAHEKCEADYTEAIPALGHKAGDVIVTEATCLAAGSAVVKCTREDCGEELNNVTIAKLPHTFNDSNKTVVEADCRNNGSVTYTCTTEGCTATLVTIISKTPHNYKKTGSVEPDCLNSGYDIYTCQNENCDSSYNVVSKSALGHNYVEDTARYVAPGCATVGHKYFKCSRVGCDAEGYDYEVPATGKHKYTETVTVKPTCETAGYSYVKCADCDSIKKDSVKSIDPLGHDYSIDLGNNVMKCSRCDKTITTQKTIADEDGTVHSFIGTITKVSTCKEKGTISYVCQNHKNCAKNFTEDLPLAEHSATADSVVVVEAKCSNDGTSADGSITVKCSVCDYVIKQIVIPAAHKYEVVKVERATCASKGKVTEKCSVCGHEKVTELEMDATAHSFPGTPYLEVAVTCTTDGYAVYKCSHCDAEKFVKTTDKLNHRNQTSETVDATCESEGYKRVTCDDCGKIISEEKLEKLPHTIVTITVDATCDKAGSITTKCSVCGKIIDVAVINPTGHTWSAWVRTKGGTCEMDGEEERTCSVCGAKETRQAGKGDHVYEVYQTVEATCEHDGYTIYKCKHCGNTYKADYTPKTGHKYSGEFVTVIEPTCHSTGSRAQICIYCKKVDPDETHYYHDIPRLEHNYGEWTIVTEPDCENNGLKTRTCQNEGCPEGYEGHTETVAIAKIGHNYGEWTVTKEANCITEGEKQRTCDRCNHVDVAVIAKGGHTRVADYAVEATCTSTGLTAGSHCSVCGYVFVAQKETPMKEHYDLGGDGKCDTCGKLMTGSDGTDTCFCHRTGFMAIVYNMFIKLIWKIFKINQTCVCGVKHY